MEQWNQIFTAVVLPLLAALAALAIAFIRKKTQELTQNIKNQTVKDNIDAAVEAILQAVQYTAQTYVDSLKAVGKFTKEAQLEAFNKAKTIAVSMISESAKQVITDAYGDFETWITTKIEQLVREDKALPEKAAESVVSTAASTAASIAATVAQTSTETAPAEARKATEKAQTPPTE